MLLITSYDNKLEEEEMKVNGNKHIIQMMTCCFLEAITIELEMIFFPIILETITTEQVYSTLFNLISISIHMRKCGTNKIPLLHH